MKKEQIKRLTITEKAQLPMDGDGDVGCVSTAAAAVVMTAVVEVVVAAAFAVEVVWVGSGGLGGCGGARPM